MIIIELLIFFGCIALAVVVLSGISGGIFSILYYFEMKNLKKNNPSQYEWRKQLAETIKKYDIEPYGVGGIRINKFEEFLASDKVQAQSKAMDEIEKLEKQGYTIDYSNCEVGPFINFSNKEK